MNNNISYGQRVKRGSKEGQPQCDGSTVSPSLYIGAYRCDRDRSLKTKINKQTAPRLNSAVNQLNRMQCADDRNQTYTEYQQIISDE